MNGAGAIQAMIQTIRQNSAMLRSSNRRHLDKDVVVRGSGTANAPIEGGQFKTEQERLDFVAKVAADKRQADRVLYTFLVIAGLLLLAFLGWILG